jgi:O-antigen/teichoic acid export membrane protein/peptidoglycan/xylan/chitin deacetylase (PgdA/CDA1 family)
LKLGAWVKHFIVYGLGVILMNLLPALMIPIYTHRVSPSVYGVLELLNRSQEMLLLILSFGLRSALLTFFQMGKDEPGRQKGVYSTALQFLGTFGFVIILLMTIGSSLWSKMLFGTRDYTSAVMLILLGTYFEMVFQMAVLYLQSELRSSLYVAIFTSRLVLAIVLNLVFVYWWRWGLMGILWSTVLHTGIYAIVTLIYVLKCTGFSFDRHLLEEMLRFGAPLMIGAFAGFLLNNGDRYFLNIYSTRADVGIYGLGYKVGVLSMSLILEPFGKIWSVKMVDISRKVDGPQELGKIATYLLIACTFSTLAVSLLSPYLIRVASAQPYWNAYKVVPVVGAAYIFYSWSTIMDASFYITRKTIYKLYILAITGCIVMALYWMLIPRYGMMGAAWATLGGYASFAALSAFFAQRIYFIHYAMRRIVCLFALTLLFYAVGSSVPITPVISGFVLRTLVTLAFPIALWFSGLITREEREALAGYWSAIQFEYLGRAPSATVGIEKPAHSNGKSGIYPANGYISEAQDGTSLRARSKVWVKAAIINCGALSIASRLGRQKIVVLYYHSIQDDPSRLAKSIVPGIIHSASLFREQMELIAEKYDLISMDDVVRFLRGETELPARPVAVTFDDGFVDNFEIAAPILNRLGIQALFNVVVGSIEASSPPWFCRLQHAFSTTRRKAWPDSNAHYLRPLLEPEDRRAAFLSASMLCAKSAGAAQEKFISVIEQELDVEPLKVEECPMMSWNQLRELRRAGHLIGSHSLTHPNLAYVDEETRWHEIAESKIQLENHLGERVDYFTYPNPIMRPNFSQLTIQTTRRAGYKLAATMMTGPVRNGQDPHCISRVPAASSREEFVWYAENSLLGRRL